MNTRLAALRVFANSLTYNLRDPMTPKDWENVREIVDALDRHISDAIIEEMVEGRMPMPPLKPITVMPVVVRAV